MDYVRLGKDVEHGPVSSPSAIRRLDRTAARPLSIFLGDESMRILAKMGEFVNLQGFTRRSPARIKFKRWKWTISTLANSRKELRSSKNILK